MANESNTGLDYFRKNTITQFVSYLSSVGASVVQAYPMAEVQSWTTQRYESDAIIAAGDAATVEMAPFLTTVCEYQYGEDATDRLTQVKEKAAEVKANADQWSHIAAYVNGVRARTQALLLAATTENEMFEIVSTATTEVEQWRAAAGV